MMLTNVPDMYIILALAVVSAVAWCAMVQYSRYVTNQKDLKTVILNGDATDKTAVDTTIGGKFWFGYVLIPGLFAVLSAVGMLYVTDIVSARGYIDGAEECALVTMVGSVLIYCALDRWLVSNLGDAAFYKKVEEQVIDGFLQNGDAALQAPITDPEVQRLIDGGFARDAEQAREMIAARKK